MQQILQRLSVIAQRLWSRGPTFSFAQASEARLDTPSGVVSLGAEQLTALEETLNQRPVTRVAIHRVPDYVLTWKGDGKFQTVSFFMKERLVYPGDHLQAWYDRTTGRPSVGRELDESVLLCLFAVSFRRCG